MSGQQRLADLTSKRMTNSLYYTGLSFEIRANESQSLTTLLITM